MAGNVWCPSVAWRYCSALSRHVQLIASLTAALPVPPMFSSSVWVEESFLSRQSREHSPSNFLTAWRRSLQVSGVPKRQRVEILCNCDTIHCPSFWSPIAKLLISIYSHIFLEHCDNLSVCIPFGSSEDILRIWIYLALFSDAFANWNKLVH